QITALLLRGFLFVRDLTAMYDSCCIKSVYTPLSLRDWVRAAPRHPLKPADAPWRACLLPKTLADKP
ncbi:TPA: hypothetical protein ACIYYZ_004889, partial [Escherichia coli]